MEKNPHTHTPTHTHTHTTIPAKQNKRIYRLILSDWHHLLNSRVMEVSRSFRLPPVFSPPVRWGLLDFNVWGSSFFSCFSSFSSSSVSSCDDVWSVWCAGPQPRSCEVSVPHRTSTAILWVQCSAPDLNRDPVSSVFRAGPQPRSCEFSVPRRTLTAILWGQCSAPDFNRDPVSWVFRAGPPPRSCEASPDLPIDPCFIRPLFYKGFLFWKNKGFLL